MNKKELAILSIDALKKEYPDAKCSLVASTPFELLVATRLSAQCTDARVNIVTPAMFKRYKTIEDFAQAEVEDIAEYIHSCGFFRTKSQDIVEMAKMIVSDYDGKVPDTIEELTKLPGVGRKTANLICGDVYHKPAVVTDTHLIRIANRIGLVSVKDPKKVEIELKKILPPEESNDFCHRIVLHGRKYCTARKANCSECPLTEFCNKKI